MTRVFETADSRYVELSAFDCAQDCDEHAHCVCGGLMAYNNRGLLVCQDCGTAALADAKSWEPAVQR